MSEKLPVELMAEAVKLQEDSLKLHKKNQPTMRDLFAMAALQGMLANSEKNWENYAVAAYLFADDMLEARKVKSRSV